MIEFDKHILPRFKFKTQISIKSKKTSENTDLSIDVKNEGISVFSDLPEKARLYIQFIEDFVECNASIISTGPSRNQTILR